MKLSLIVAAFSALSAPILVAAGGEVGMVVYVFDGSYAGGIDGTIQTVWNAGILCDRVTVKADLDFKRVDLAALAKADGNCTGPVKEYAYHIHTKWIQPNAVSTSAAYTQCAKAITGNHYDPNKACGPASEFSDLPDCTPKIKNYKCTPKRYMEDSAHCEFGDLSGKLGTFKPNKRGVVKAEWTDSLYPSWQAHQPTWNIVIHAVCGKATPRVACAVGHKLGPTRQHLKRMEAKHMKGEEEEEEEEEDLDKAMMKEEDGDDDDDDNDDDDDDDDDDNENEGEEKVVMVKVHVHNEE